ncbi:glycosyltransferase family 2 protein [Christiangramia salexigens]|uniref:Glycosyltransferase 2-like domain-containing protein n=1 Tax=Christiangramia salexigens TaxID=1913577 RepID=A0A1L3J4Q8_9FLAO|nr:glycosyltransferase family 2 protein [Christiangramia salexigens]APG60115.1 hypothetical protein LPB144_06655 [Christiangramia salexigens]
MSNLGEFPFFSIIIPTYNSEDNLMAALVSLKNQIYNNYEVIIIDNLSSDNTVLIAKQFLKNLPAVKIISEKDKGIYHAMNKGVKMSSGKWLYFMGADDKLYDGFVLKKIYDKVASDKIGVEVIYGNVKSNYFNNLYDGKFSKYKIARKNICHQAIFLKKSVFSKIGGFNLKYKVLADWEHNIRWFYSKRIKHLYIDLVVADYGEGGFSSQHTDKKFHRDKNHLIVIQFFKIFKSFFRIEEKKT